MYYPNLALYICSNEHNRVLQKLYVHMSLYNLRKLSRGSQHKGSTAFQSVHKQLNNPCLKLILNCSSLSNTRVFSSPQNVTIFQKKVKAIKIMQLKERIKIKEIQKFWIFTSLSLLYLLWCSFLYLCNRSILWSSSLERENSSSSSPSSSLGESVSLESSLRRIL